MVRSDVILFWRINLAGGWVRRYGLPLAIALIVIAWGRPAVAMQEQSVGDPVTLRNAGFEEGVTAPEDWHPVRHRGKESDSRTELDDNGYAGKKALKISWLSGYPYVGVEQRAVVRGDRAYRLRTWYRTQDSTRFYATFVAYDEFGNVHQSGKGRFEAVDDWREACYEFNLAPGAVSLAVQLQAREGTVWCDEVSLHEIGAFAAYDSLSAAQRAEWEAFKSNTRVLNNLVTELVNRSGALLRDQDEIAFVTPRKGWIYVASEAEVVDGGKLALRIDGVADGKSIIVHVSGAAAVQTTMRYVPAGARVIVVQRQGEVTWRNLVVRAIPEIWVNEYESEKSGRYEWMQQHDYLPATANTTIENFFRHMQKDRWALESADAASEERMAAWRRQGRRVLNHVPTVHMVDAAMPLEITPTYLKTSMGLGPTMDGILVDELTVDKEEVDLYLDVLKDIRGDRRWANKGVYLYYFGDWGCRSHTRSLRRFVMEQNEMLVQERYLLESASITEARQNIADNLIVPLRSSAYDMPGILDHTMAALCISSLNYYGENCYPTADYKVFLDMQFKVLADRAEFAGLPGITGWVARLADDETLRWYDRLLQHYCIDGKRTLLSEEYGYQYELTHIRNPDFNDGLTGWDVKPARLGSIQVGHMRNYGYARGTNAKAPAGDRFALLKSHPGRTNRLSQRIVGLQVGRLYSVKMYTADHRNFQGRESVSPIHRVRVNVESADMLTDRTTRMVYDSRDCYHYAEGRMPSDIPICFNYHVWFFRAIEPQARLTISDEQNGRDGHSQEVMLNFIEVQPHYEGE